MSPWAVIGYAVLAPIVGLVALLLLHLVVEPLITLAWARWYHYRTRDLAPKVGDIWVQGKTNLIIEHNASGNGRIVVKVHGVYSTAGWSDSPEEWRERVRRRKLWRLAP
ncbi:MAG: hypothetical protein EHM89_00340 [Acidobacteria bacterium]|nr:MAG: hypothetical protein EHM89_00340 [Acidobacteriota bacterium]